ncbi:MAG: metallophosphoesterase [Candidatus Micrarchaeia archaeon]
MQKGKQKILILSDIHYPMKCSSLAFPILEREKPDFLVLLGDSVELSKSSHHVELWKSFLQKLYMHITPDKIILILGDNDYSNDRKVYSFVSRIEKYNNDIKKYSIGNMFFYHGNIEKTRIQEKIEYKTARFFYNISKRSVPFIVSKLVYLKMHPPHSYYKFIGHIHYLGKYGNTIFCGTLSKKRVIYDEKNSFGYVIVYANNFRIEKPSDIIIVREGACK